MFSDALKDKLKHSVPLVDVLSEFTQLQRRGGSIVGCCPFHKEKTPSFYVYESDQHYHCYGCKAHGDIFDLLMEKRGYSFTEVIEHLCQRTGTPMPRSKGAEEVNQEKAYYELLSFVADFYVHQRQEPCGRKALQYLQETRGLSSKAIDFFRVGFAPDGEKLVHYLRHHGYSLEEAKKLGVIKEGSYGPYDFMARRIVFPIWNLRGKVVGFSGRETPQHPQKAKYVNTSESPVFKKKEILYNAHAIRAQASDQDPIVCVEGHLDVISLYNAGYPKAVAAMGTAFDQDRLVQLHKMTRQAAAHTSPVICFDGDAAGQAAARSTFYMALPVLSSDRLIRFLSLPRGMDPDTYVKTYTLEDWRHYVKDHSLSAYDFMRRNVVPRELQEAGYTADAPESRAQTRKKIQEIAQKIGDPILGQEWLGAFKRDFYQKRSGYKPYKRRDNEGLQVFSNGTAPNLPGRQSHSTEALSIFISWLESAPFLCDHLECEQVVALIEDPHLATRAQACFDRYHSSPDAYGTDMTDEGLLKAVVGDCDQFISAFAAYLHEVERLEALKHKDKEAYIQQVPGLRQAVHKAKTGWETPLRDMHARLERAQCSKKNKKITK